METNYELKNNNHACFNNFLNLNFRRHLCGKLNQIIRSLCSLCLMSSYLLDHWNRPSTKTGERGLIRFLQNSVHKNKLYRIENILVLGLVLVDLVIIYCIRYVQRKIKYILELRIHASDWTFEGQQGSSLGIQRLLYR